MNGIVVKVTVHQIWKAAIKSWMSPSWRVSIFVTGAVRVAEMVPVRVAEIVPVLVADIVPDFAWIPVEKTSANIAAPAMVLTFFIVLLLMFSNVLGNGSAQMFALLSHLWADFN
ncbi:MAG TPA: hypothetical protein VFI24_10740 [Pyrinomonadaceae bacterium]|nr:hypothetical protein [Pyrinomonadaceae bacterium]